MFVHKQKSQNLWVTCCDSNHVPKPIITYSIMFLMLFRFGYKDHYCSSYMIKHIIFQVSKACFFQVAFWGVSFIFRIYLSCFIVQDKQKEEATSSISRVMDLLETHDVQTLVDTLHKYFEYEQHLKLFMFIEIEHNEQIKQQRLGFIVKCLRKFGVVNATKLEAIKWDQSHVRHIFSNDECLLQSEQLTFPWIHS